MVLGVVGQMHVPGEKYQSWEGVNPSRASLCYTNTRKMLIQLSLFLHSTNYYGICKHLPDGALSLWWLWL